MEIIDIHNHILYGLDDGASNMEESMKLINQEFENGVRGIIFTPHYQTGVYEARREKVEERVAKLSEACGEKYPGLRLYLGNEILYTQDVNSLLSSGRIATMAGSRYVLVEFMINVDYPEMERCLKEILTSGHVPILAHCERYKCISKSIVKIKHLIDIGAYMQVNADIFTSFAKKRFVKKLIDEDCLHFVATDAHNMSGRGVTWKKCLEVMNKLYDEEYIRWLLYENPMKVINDEIIS